MLPYFANLPKGKIILWCYLIWYLAVVCFHFDPDLQIWLNSIGISGVIGIALILGVSRADGSRLDGWQVFRLFATPFCVSSYSALIKGQGFIFILPPNPIEQAVAFGACMAFVLFVLALKTAARRAPPG
jgi:hypothetical protein